MDLTQFKRRKLDSFLLSINVTRMEVNVLYDERICKKNFYTFIGINIYGKRVYLTYGIDYNEDTEFFLRSFKDIRARGVDTVLYLVSQALKLCKRAAEVTFAGVKVLKSNVELIDRVNKYLPNNFSNKFPADLTNLYTSESLEKHEEDLKYFKEKYKEIKIINILINEDLDLIKRIYNLSYNKRKLLFTYYNVRDYRRLIRKENNKGEIIKCEDDLFNGILEAITSHEKYMYPVRAQWLEILEELSESEETRKYL